MVPIRNKAFILLVGMFIVAFLLVACSPEVTLLESPSTKVAPTERSETQPSRTLPATNDISLAATETSSPANPPDSAFAVCDQQAEGANLDNETSQGEGLSLEIDSLIPPAPPANASFSLSQESVEVTWPGTGTDVDQFYNVYRLGQEQDCWKSIGMEPVEGDNRGVYTFDTVIADKLATYIYALTTVDIYGNESDLTIAAESEPGS